MSSKQTAANTTIIEDTQDHAAGGDGEFKMTPEIQAAMDECRWSTISKATKERIGTAQMIRDLKMNHECGHKIQLRDRKSGREMGIMSGADMIRHENELRKICLFMKKQDMNKRMALMKSQKGIFVRDLSDDNEYADYLNEILLILAQDFGKIGGRVKDWKIGWMGSRWRDIKCDDGFIVRCSYYGPRSQAVHQIREHANFKGKHAVILCSSGPGIFQ